MSPPFDLTPFIRPLARRRLQAVRNLDPIIAQRRCFRALLNRGRRTRFGRDHDFDRITTVADFQAAVPLRTYEAFWDEYWSASFPVLENVTWPGRIPFWALTSGTTSGKTKHIPLTRATIRQNRRAAFDMLAAHLTSHEESHLLGGVSVVLGGSTALTPLAPGVVSGDLSGIVNATAPNWLRPFTFPPKDVGLLEDWDEKIDAFVRLAGSLPVRSVSGVPSWLLIFFARLEEYWQGWPWPDLELLVHGGVPWRPYASRFSDYLRRSGATSREVYPASEGFIAFADSTADAALLLSTDTGLFFEFVPVEELGSARPIRHWIANVEREVDYALVLSGPSGLWAYLLGDTVRFADLNPPRLLISGRTAYMLSAFGEHVIESELEDAIAGAVEAAGARVAEFCAGPLMPANGGSRGGHLFLIESEPSVALDATELAKRIDRRLAELNDDYRAHRQGMEPPEVRLLSSGSFNRWMDAQGKLGGQHKVPRVIADPARFAAAADALAQCDRRA